MLLSPHMVNVPDILIVWLKDTHKKNTIDLAN